VTTATVSATTMETPATVETTTSSTTEAANGAIARSTARESTRITEGAAAMNSYIPTSVVASTVIPATIVASTAVEAATVISAAIEPAAIVAAAEPGTGANEDAASEPVGAVVAVGSAGVRSVAVVAVSANRRGIISVVVTVSRAANSNAYRNPLRIRITSAKQRNRQKQSRYTCKPEVSHVKDPLSSPLLHPSNQRLAGSGLCYLSASPN
jgi:hypothetical protein